MVTEISLRSKPSQKKLSVFFGICALTFVNLLLVGVELVPNSKSLLEEDRFLLELPLASDLAVLDSSSGDGLGSGSFLSFVIFS
jgi:hypothetical protein